ncbi:MAG: hypothetical protein QM754_04545 [Tepidisphaeraceae bacterium]
MLEVTAEDAWQSLSDDMLRQRLQRYSENKDDRAARAKKDEKPVREPEPAPASILFGNPAKGFYVTRQGVPGTPKQYSAVTDFAFRLDHGVLMGACSIKLVRNKSTQFFNA